MKVGLIGRGFVGDALYRSFCNKGKKVLSYDKYKNIGTFESILDSDIIFLCLPTPFMENVGFDKSSIEITCDRLAKNEFDGLVVIKSTIEPGTTRYIFNKYNINVAHNPEFLTARTSYYDFDNQSHIVLGKVLDSKEFNNLVILYSSLFKDSKISICSSEESESMKLFSNCFYAVKVQFFNELYLLCNKMDIEYDRVIDLIIKNGWMSKMHTMVPGPDGELSYGGKCFPKDTMALEAFMSINGISHEVLSAAVRERGKMRDD